MVHPVYGSLKNETNFKNIIYDVSRNTLLGITGEEISVGLMWACSLGHVKVYTGYSNKHGN